MKLITGAVYGSTILVKTYLQVSVNISDFVSTMHQDFSDQSTITTPSMHYRTLYKTLHHHIMNLHLWIYTPVVIRFWGVFQTTLECILQLPLMPALCLTHLLIL